MKNDDHQYKISEEFSRRDKSRHDLEYSGEKKKGDRDQYFVIGIIVLAFLSFYGIVIPEYQHFFLNENNLRYIFSASAQTLGAILGITFTIVLIFFQLNLPRYGFFTYRRIIGDKFIVLFLSSSGITIILSLITILLVGEMKTFTLGPITLAASYWYLFILGMIFLSIALLPYILLRMIRFLDERSNFEISYNDLISAIKKGSIKGIEDHISSIVQRIEFGITHRENLTVKEGIETLHDIIKFIIDNNKLVYENLESGALKKGFRLPKSDWFLEDIMVNMSYFYKLLIKSNQLSVANYLVDAIRSCAIESLNYKQKRNTRIIINAYKSIILYSLELNNREFIEFRLKFRFFFETSLILNEKEFFILFIDLTEREFLTEILKSKPWRIGIIFDDFWNLVHYLNTFMGHNFRNIKNIVTLILNYVHASEQLEELGFFDSKWIEKENKRMRDIYLQKAYLISLYSLWIGKPEIAKICKEMLREKLDLRTMLNKIEKDVDPIYGLGSDFNQDTHFMFTEYQEDKSKFDYQKLKKIAKKFDNL